jgi:hypothetical protein
MGLEEIMYLRGVKMREFVLRLLCNTRTVMMMILSFGIHEG